MKKRYLAATAVGLGVGIALGYGGRRRRQLRVVHDEASDVVRFLSVLQSEVKRGTPVAAAYRRSVDAAAPRLKALLLHSAQETLAGVPLRDAIAGTLSQPLPRVWAVVVRQLEVSELTGASAGALADALGNLIQQITVMSQLQAQARQIYSRIRLFG